MRAGSLLAILWLSACSAREIRRDCAVQVLDHPSLPRPAGRIAVTCDGLRRATIDAGAVHLPAEATCAKTR